MQGVQQIAFILLSAISIWLFSRNILRIRKNILSGKKEDYSDQRGRRWKNVLLLAFGQKKMFRNPMVSVLHFFIYAGFIIINLEVLEIFLDGISAKHRLFRPLGESYILLINAFEILALLVLLACVIFLIRRNILKIKRFLSHDLDGWPRSDANYILITEIILMSLFLTMNASDTLLQERYYRHFAFQPTGNFLISQWLHVLLSGLSNHQLLVLERTCWWLHITGIFAFLNYLPYSKHLHILLAFPNAYYGRLEPKGKMDNMENVQNEVIYMFKPELAPTIGNEQTHKFGAKDVFDLSWKNLLDAYSCTECGRCTSACPANITGKLLSPRKIMMDTRDRLEEVGKNMNTNGVFKDDEKNLLSYITVEELRACTSCNACV